MSRKPNVVVKVSDNLERGLRKLKKLAEREGVMRDMKRIVYHEGPSQKRRKRFLRAVKKNLMIRALRDLA